MSRPIVILGARGMLGTEVVSQLRAAGRRYVAYDLPEWDITRTEDLAAAVPDGGIVINCAAYTNVDGAERESDLAHEVNGRAVGRLGDLARAREAAVIHISTDFVFDGRLDRPYVETDAPNPLNVYGRSKLAGEQALQASGCPYCIVRVQWTYGRAGRNFVTKILDLARTKDMLRVVDDQVGSPTSTRQVAEVLRAMIDAPAFPTGLFHMAAAGYASRHEVARFIVERAGLSVRIEPCGSEAFATPAVRPKNSRFDCTRLRQWLGRPIRKWQPELAQFVEGSCNYS